MNTNRVWVLGASDPEMSAIDAILLATGEKTHYATDPSGQRCHPGNSYCYDGSRLVCDDLELPGRIIVQVECDYDRSGQGPSGRVIQVDHHRPGDPGYGKGPTEFWSASSIGQVCSLLGIQLIHDEVFGWSSDVPANLPCGVHQMLPGVIPLVAAADHCLINAYRGQCSGVDPEALMRWRISTRATFQGRSQESILTDVQAARTKLRQAVRQRCARCGDPQDPGNPCLGVLDHGFPGGEGPCGDAHEWVGPDVADLRGQDVPELPEAAAREGIPFLSSVKDKDGRRKTVLQCAPPDLVKRFLDGVVVGGLTNCYGDPARGFAGGYED